jgi:wobble nucleotide-excising tRNase
MIFKKKEKEKTPQEILDCFINLEKKVNELEKEIEERKKENRKMLQKIGLIRFNPFSGTGGDQSFSLAFLDEDKNGVVITSLYANEKSSVYGKPIENGKSLYVLSEEEKEAIKIASQEKVFVKKTKKRKK